MERQARNIPEPDIAVLRDGERAAWFTACLLQRAASEALSQAPVFTVALSGGSTPMKMFDLLSTAPQFSNIPWDRIHIFWTDERRVPTHKRESNYGNTKRHLLDKISVPLENIHPWPVSLPHTEGAEAYENELRTFFRLSKGLFPAFDLMLLGAGTDGHVASLFPQDPALEIQDKMAAAVEGGTPFLKRLTLTLPVINNSKRLLLVLTGMSKAKIFAKIMSDPACDLPAAMVRPLNGKIGWVVDRKAASIFLHADC